MGLFFCIYKGYLSGPFQDGRRSDSVSIQPRFEKAKIDDEIRPPMKLADAAFVEAIWGME